MRSLALAFFLVTFGLPGCTHLEPRRTSFSPEDQTPDCTPDTGYVSDACGDQIVETSDSYQLHYAEFDDQGRPYENIPRFGQAYRQIDMFLSNVDHSVADSTSGDSVVVFVHGWLHSSANKDTNLVSFRRVLTQLAQVEQFAFCRRKVIGLYVAWRGAGTMFAGHPADTLTFWSRKYAAEQIATGSFQQILAGLKAMQSTTPDRINASRGPTDPDCSSRLKTMYVGHSFGGLIVMSSMSQGLARDLMIDQIQRAPSAPDSTRTSQQGPDEVVVAINPAIEGARFDSLFRVALKNNYATYRSPRFIAITSRDDWATGTLFPLGRSLNLMTKRYPEGDKKGRDAAGIAVGHDRQYLTRTLIDSSQYKGPAVLPDYCKDADPADPLDERARKDVDRMRAFHASVGGQYDANDAAHWPRLFCVIHEPGSTTDTGVLVMDDFGQIGMNRNTPVWNISTASPIVNDHNDIENARLIEFLRQIYVDSMFFR